MGAIVSNPEAIKKVKSDIALVFDTDKPTTSIQANKYVVWRNKLYMTNRAISTSDSFVPGDNIREVTDGVGNDLYSNITHVTTFSGTTDGNGNLSINATTSSVIVIGAYCDQGYIASEFVFSGSWLLHFTDFVDGSNKTNVSVSGKYVYRNV